MPILNFGEKAPESNVVFKAEDNITYKARLFTEVLLYENFYFVNSANFKGYFLCNSPLADQLAGYLTKNTHYLLPLWIYTSNNWEGELQILRLTPYQYDKMLREGSTDEYSSFDVKLWTEKKGKGFSLEFRLDRSSYSLINSAPPTVLEKIQQSLSVFPDSAKASYKILTDDLWEELISEVIPQPSTYMAPHQAAPKLTAPSAQIPNLKLKAQAPVIPVTPPPANNNPFKSFTKTPPPSPANTVPNYPTKTVPIPQPVTQTMTEDDVNDLAAYADSLDFQVNKL